MSATALRGHHFVCLQFFRGEGYSPEFVANLARVISRAADTPAVLVDGADDVCAACPGLAEDGTCSDPQAGEDEVEALDALALEALAAKPGDELSLAHARERLAANPAAVARWRQEACEDCGWRLVCESGWEKLLGR
jgi:hypothetical protein